MNNYFPTMHFFLYIHLAMTSQFTERHLLKFRILFHSSIPNGSIFFFFLTIYDTITQALVQ